MPKRNPTRQPETPRHDPEADLARRLVDLARQQGAAAIPDLREALQHRDPWVRLHAVEALCAIDSPDVLATLVGALHDPSFGVGWQAAEALSRQGRAGVIAVLRGLLHDTPSTIFLHGVEHVLRHAALAPEEREAAAPVLDALHRPAADLEAPLLAVGALERLDTSRPLTPQEREAPYIRLRETRRPLRGHIFPGPQEG